MGPLQTLGVVDYLVDIPMVIARLVAVLVILVRLVMEQDVALFVQERDTVYTIAVILIALCVMEEGLVMDATEEDQFVETSFKS